MPKKSPVTLEEVVKLIDSLAIATAEGFKEQRIYIDSRFAQQREYMDKKFEAIDARFKQVDARFEVVEARLTSVETRLTSVETRIERLETQLAVVQEDVKDLRYGIKRIESYLDNQLATIISDHAYDIKQLKRATSVNDTNRE